MFENIIGQQNIVHQLQTEYFSKTLPSSMLYYGEPYSGKLTTALELTRVLLCERGTADWNCSCGSCRQNRSLTHPNMLLLGPRDFFEEINACSDVLLRHHVKPALFLFLRSIRKLIRRFDPVIWEGNETKGKRINDLITQLESLLEPLSPDAPLPEHAVLEKIIKDCKETAASLAGEYPKDNIPIDQVRNIVSWAHTTTSGAHKAVILENADKMGESSRNALLKILEEPPKGAYFILITTRKGLIISTILSRLRQYHFRERDALQSKEVLEKIFRDTAGEYRSLQEYFFAWKDIRVNELYNLSVKYITLLMDRNPQQDVSIEHITADIKDKDHARYFLHELSRRFEERLGISPLKNEKLAELRAFEKWTELMRECMFGIERFNQRPSFLLEDLFYRMRAVI